MTEPAKPHILTFIRPVRKPPTAPPMLAVMKARPYFKLIPYMAGSVTPQNAEMVAGHANSFTLATFDLRAMAKTAPLGPPSLRKRSR